MAAARERMLKGLTYPCKDCISLFGYAEEVHQRSSGVCQYCGYGSDIEVDSPLYISLWRQLSVEHVIGESQGGYNPRLKDAVSAKFPGHPIDEIERIVDQINIANTVTTCRFCNDTTSRYVAQKTMEAFLAEAQGQTPDEVIAEIQRHLTAIFEDKKCLVLWKLSSIEPAFQGKIKDGLRRERQRQGKTS
jgi:hypothetical protein